MRVEIWADIICPWCGLGARQLDQALARFEHGSEVELVNRSFELDERAPEGQTQSVRTRLKTTKGLTDGQVEAMVGRVEQLAAAQGLKPYVVLENQVGNTSLAHELAAWASTLGRGKEIWDALYRTYFGQARSVFDVESLVALAGELGLPLEDAREVLTSRRFAAQVKEEGREARELGANGVPFILIDRRFAVSGAQPVDAMVQALERAWSSRATAAEPPR